MSNSIAPGSSADVNVRVTALTTNPNVPAQYKTIILKKNLVNGVNTLTQEMMSATNTKYVIKYDYVLGEDIIIPANCVLECDGGSLSTHNITLGDNCKIIDGDFKNFGTITCGNNNLIKGCTIFGLSSNLGVIKANGKENIIIDTCYVEVDNEHNTNVDVGCIYMLNTSNIKIENSEFVGGKNQSYGSLVTSGCGFGLCSDILVNKCTLHGCSNEGFDFANCENVSITDCVAYETGDSGISSEGGTEIIVKGNHCYNTGYSCITINSERVSVIGNTVHDNNNAHGITLGHIENGNFDDVGVVDGDGRNVVCIGNTIYNSAEHGIACSNPRGVTISDNNIKSSGRYGIYLSAAQGDTTPCYGFIYNNVIDGAARGIVAGSNSAANSIFKVVNNTILNIAPITGVACMGIEIGGSDIKLAYIKGNSISSNNLCRDGIQVAAKTAVIMDNFTIDCLRSGIMLLATPEAIIKNNYLRVTNNSTVKGVVFDSNEGGNYGDGVFRMIENNTLHNYYNGNIIYVETGIYPNKTNIIIVNTNELYGNVSLSSFNSSNIVVSNSNRVKRTIKNNTFTGYPIGDIVTSDAERPSLASYEAGYQVTNNGALQIWNGSSWVTIA